MKERALIADHRRFALSLVYGLSLSAAIAFGHQMERLEHLMFTFFTISRVLLLGGLIAVAVYFLLGRLHTTHDISRRLLSRELSQDATNPRVLRRYFFKVWGGLVLCQIPVFLGVFPGFFVYDASDEMYQIITRNFTTHHPLIHVLTMGGTVQGIYKLTGSYNAGIATYIGAQAVLICAAFALILTLLKHWGVVRGWRIFSFLYLGVFPPVVMYTLCSAKDGIFSAAFLLFTALLLMMSEERSRFTGNRRKVLFFIIITTIMLLYRNNALYAYLVFLPFGILLYPRRKKTVRRRKVAGLLIAPLVLALLTNQLLARVTNAYDKNYQEFLTVPIQQMARIQYFYPGELSDADRAVLFHYLPEEHLRHYRPRLSDPVKVGFNNQGFEEDPASFWRLWGTLLREHPVAYLNAWLMTSYGYWYPLAVINVYQGNEVFTFTYDESSYFGYEVEEPGVRHSFIPVIDEIYKTLSIRKAQQEIPVISLFFAPAFYFWIMAFVALYLLTDTRGDIRRRALLFLPLFLYWLTLLLGPTYLVRYVVILLETTVLIPVFLRSQDGNVKD